MSITTVDPPTNFFNNAISKNRKKIEKLQSKLYYINNKQKINKKRKEYKRQTWKERKDNPKNIPNCLNAECNNRLTSWEIRRMHPSRVSKWWFCGKCRHIAHRHPIYVKCFKCGIKFIHLNNQKYCDECATHARGRDIS
jgi:hypothetical protein